MGTRGRRELLLLLLVVCLWAFDAAWHYDLASSWESMHRPAASGLGGVFGVLLTAFLGLGLISWRRHLDGLGEARGLGRTWPGDPADEATSLLLADSDREVHSPQPSRLGAAEACGEIDSATDQSLYLGVPDRSGLRLLALVNQVLGSRHEVAPSTGSGPFDVRLLVGEVAAHVRPSAERKGLFFTCTVRPGIPGLVHGDPLKLSRVLTDLLDNAIECTDSGWIRLVVSSGHHFGDQVSVRFEVHDSGIGVAKDQERRLYLAVLPSTPGTAPRSDDVSGRDLGVTQQLVTSMGGAITLSSARGLGSAFSFSLRFSLPGDGTV